MEDQLDTLKSRLNLFARAISVPDTLSSEERGALHEAIAQLRADGDIPDGKRVVGPQFDPVAASATGSTVSIVSPGMKAEVSS